MLKIAVLVSGGGSNLQAIIDAISRKEIDCEIVQVISSKAGVYAITRAEANSIKTETIERKKFAEALDFDKKLLASLKNSGAELVVLAGFLSVLGPEVVSEYKNRIINIHPALIPAFCGKGCYGLKVHKAVIDAGVKVTGATVHFVDEGCDSGPIILQKPVCVNDNDTPETLQERVMKEAEWVLLPKAIGLIAENRVTIEGSKTYIREKLV